MTAAGATTGPDEASFRLEGLLGVGVGLLSLGLLATPRQWLAVLPPAALAGLLVLARWPAFGLYLILALIPFWDFRTLAGPVQIHWLIAGVLLAVLTLQQAIRRELPRSLASNLWLFFAVFGLASLISALLSPYRAVALAGVVRLGLGAAFIALVLVLLDAKGFIDRLPAVLVWSVSASAGLAVLGFFAGVELFADPGEEAFARGTGGAGGPVNLAFLIVVIFPLLGYWLVFERRAGRRLAALALLLVNLLALFTTFSRGGGILLVLVALGLLVEYLPHFRLRHLLVLIGATGLVLAVALPAAPDYYWERLGLLGAQRDKASQRRLSYYKVAREAIAERPWLGHGPGAFKEIYAGTEEARHFARTDQERYRYAHNTYLEVLVGTGGLGLAAYLALLVAGWRNFGQAKRLLLLRRQPRLALLVGTYRMSYLAVAAYLFLKSGVDNKSLLLGLALSAVAVRVARGPLPDPE